MKKILFILAGLFLLHSAEAQQLEKKLLINGGAGFSVGKATPVSSLYDHENTVSMRLNPRLGFFPVSNLVFGVQSDLFFSRYKYEINRLTVRNKSNSYLVGPFIRYYFGQEKIMPFIDGGLAWGNTTAYTTSSADPGKENESESALFNASLTAGVAVWITPQVAFEFGAQFRADREDLESDALPDEVIKTRTFAATLGFTLLL